MSSIASFLPEVQSLPLAEFLNRYPHPFLLISAPQKMDLVMDNEYHTMENKGDGSSARQATSPVHLVEKQVYELKKGAEGGAIFLFAIGRSSKSDIVLAGTEISKQHAVIQQTATGNAIMDSSSRNGTVLNGVRMQPRKLYPLADKDLVVFAGVFAAKYLLPGSLHAWLKGDRQVS